MFPLRGPLTREKKVGHPGVRVGQKPEPTKRPGGLGAVAHTGAQRAENLAAMRTEKYIFVVRGRKRTESGRVGRGVDASCGFPDQPFKLHLRRLRAALAGALAPAWRPFVLQ